MAKSANRQINGKSPEKYLLRKNDYFFSSLINYLKSGKDNKNWRSKTLIWAQKRASASLCSG